MPESVRDILKKLDIGTYRKKDEGSGRTTLENSNNNIEYTVQKDDDKYRIYRGFPAKDAAPNFIVTKDVWEAKPDTKLGGGDGNDGDGKVKSDDGKEGDADVEGGDGDDPPSIEKALWDDYMAKANPDLAAAVAFWKLYGKEGTGAMGPMTMGLGALQTAFALVGRDGLTQIVQGLGVGLWHALATPMRQPQYKPDG
tara:strand:- start:644 stop:1234 length:591 start_codon:yes stop_codon:yes gene_type:complete